MTNKAKTNEKGQVTLTLTISGVNVLLNPPKTKHLKAIQVAANQADATDVGLAQVMVQLLTDKWGDRPTVTMDDLDDLDPRDFMEVASALDNFPAMAKFKEI